MSILQSLLLAVVLFAAVSVSHQRPDASSWEVEVWPHDEPKPQPEPAHEPPHVPDPEPEPKPDPEPEPKPGPEPKPKPPPQPSPKPKPQPPPEPKPPSPPKKLPRAYLQDLVIPSGEELVPPFQSFQYRYQVNTTRNFLSVRPVLADNEEHKNFVIEVDDEIVANDTESSKLKLQDAAGPQIIEVKVSGPGYRTTVYEILVTKVHPEKRRRNKIWTVLSLVIVVTIVAILAALFYRATQRARSEGRPWPWSTEPASGAYGTLPGHEPETTRRT